MCSTPLASWRFSGSLRTYQADALDRLPTGSADPLHVVAPPGSGKTLLGLLLAAREGDRTLVLAPTLVIRQQWTDAARDLAPDSAAVSADPHAPAALTALTYQLLSVTGDGTPFEDLARLGWEEELCVAGRTQSDAATALAELAVDNPGAFRSGIRRRVRNLRSQFTRQRPELIGRVLHPNAVAVIDKLVDHGIRTIILDECHHLLDHWALVVAYLVGRLRERGIEPLLIGLTATLPSPDDRAEYDNYSQLLGDVDYEVPTPAVVKEGHLAPYRDTVAFTTPTDAELAFLRDHEHLLNDLLTRVLATPDGVGYLTAQLQPPGESTDDAAARLEQALANDFALARTCAVVLRKIEPSHPIANLLPDALLERCTTDDLLTALARFAQSRLLNDPTAKDQWEYVRRALADFGYRLGDSGIRRGRDVVESTLAHSAGKDHATVSILRTELSSSESERIRAVVVADFVEHGNHNGAWGPAAAGAVRVFEMLAADPTTASLRPVLLTSQLLRTRTADAAMIAGLLGEILGAPVPVSPGADGIASLQVSGTAAVVAAVSELISRGEVRVLVSTRGLLGEGWDCPAVNTLIDLTSATTSSSTQQLRGRTLRLDPAWPQKVAHNWSIACLIPPEIALDDDAETRRLQRKHGHLWGPSIDSPPQIVAGLGHALSAAAWDELERVASKAPDASIAQLNALTDAARPTRAETRADWRIGDTYSPVEREVVALRRSQRSAPLLRTAPAASAAAIGGFTAAGAVALIAQWILIGQGVHLGAPSVALVSLGAGGLGAGALAARSLWGALRDRTHPAAVYRLAAVALARTLHEAGRTSRFDEEAIVVRADTADPLSVRIEVGGGDADRRLLADAVEELFGPVRTPRFLLRVDRSAARSTPLIRLADRLSPWRTLLSVPRIIGRRRSDAENFQRHWTQLIGECSLHELEGVTGLALLRAARAAGSRLDGAQPRAQVWG
ncbi:DEAD/DEAH box helicase family protein [Microbacterium sp.]|uniref:DEAD/DEAH box helicase family protein n=1 Tax=Microbacterium sp. TaxID=51671 RepID=UPI003A94538C